MAKKEFEVVEGQEVNMETVENTDVVETKKEGLFAKGINFVTNNKRKFIIGGGCVVAGVILYKVIKNLVGSTDDSVEILDSDNYEVVEAVADVIKNAEDVIEEN